MFIIFIFKFLLIILIAFLFNACFFQCSFQCAYRNIFSSVICYGNIVGNRWMFENSVTAFLSYFNPSVFF